MFKPDRSIESSYGPLQGTTKSASAVTPIPAFGWTHEVTPGKVVVGIAGLGAGGFGVDYPSDNANPLLMPRPQGFGNLYSNFQLMKIIPAAAFAIMPRVWLGIAANVDWAALSVDPMPTAAPTMSGSGASMVGFYPSAAHSASAFGVGAQLGIQAELNEHTWVGASITTPQWFQDFEWNAVNENPAVSNFQAARKVTFGLDAPAIYSAGLATRPMDGLFTAIDLRYVTYSSTRGFSEKGFSNDGSVRGFGWKDIFVAAVGAAYDATPDLVLRGGYNFTQNPVPAELSMFNAPAPAIVQHHATAGATFRITDTFGVDVGYYHAFASSITGQMVSPAGAAPSSSVKNTLSEDSFLLSFSFGAHKK